MKKIRILGTGCPKCKMLFDTTWQAVNEAGILAEIVKVEDITEIMKFGIMMTPALVVDGEVKIMGRVPRVTEIMGLLK